MKFLALALATLIPITAVAEDFMLYQNQFWEVHYRAPGDLPPWCSAVTKLDARNSSTGIMADGFNTQFMVHDGNINFDGLVGRVHFWIDGRQPWYGRAEGTGSTLFIDSPVRDFLAEIYQGHVFYVDLEDDGFADYVFPLRGSAAAMRALSDCISKLR